jgi:hypothetical protein
MKLLQTIVFFGLHALASAKLPEGSHRSMAAEPEEMSAQEHGSVRKRSPGGGGTNNPNNTYRSRRNKASGQGGGDNGGGDGGVDKAFGAAHACRPFESIPWWVMQGTPSVGGDEICKTKNACNTGCCRIASQYMVCDLGGSKQNFDTLQVRDD